MIQFAVATTCVSDNSIDGIENELRIIADDIFKLNNTLTFIAKMILTGLLIKIIYN